MAAARYVMKHRQRDEHPRRATTPPCETVTAKDKSAVRN